MGGEDALQVDTSCLLTDVVVRANIQPLRTRSLDDSRRWWIR